MKELMTSIWIFLLLILINNQCKKESHKNEEIIPLDGRGGGVIAYCEQNLNATPQHKVYAVNADGTGNSKLIAGDYDLNHFNFSPDRNFLATTGYIGGTNGTWSIYTYSFATSTLLRITTTSNVWDGDPAYSPDGTLIIFTRTYPLEESRNEIWLVNGDGTDLHYSGIEGLQPKFSPDGTRLAYASNISGSWEIYTCNINGTDVQRLTNNSSDEFAPDWSPDGNKIAFASTRDGNYEIFVMNYDGTEVVRLTNNSAYDSQPKWSPDGTLIAFHSERLGISRYQIFVMNADGSNVRQVTNVVYPAGAINPVWRPK